MVTVAFFLQLIDGGALILFNILEMRRREARLFFELTREMLLTAVVKFKSNFAERFFIIDDEFFSSFNFLKNKIALNGFAFYGRKESA